MIDRTNEVEVLSMRREVLLEDSMGASCIMMGLMLTAATESLDEIPTPPNFDSVGRVLRVPAEKRAVGQEQRVREHPHGEIGVLIFWHSGTLALSPTSKSAVN